MSDYDRQKTTRKLDTSSPYYPVKDQDDYSPQDHNRDGIYADGKIGDAIREIFSTIPCVVSGGVVSDGGGGTLDITALIAISEWDEEVENGVSETDVVRILNIDALTGWMDAGADDAGATNYIKCRYQPTDHGDTRSYLYKAGTYNYKQIDSYLLEADTTAPVSGEVCLGEFTKVAGSITGVTVVNRSPEALIKNALSRVRKNSAGSVFERRRLNFIEGAGMSLTVADDPTDEEVDITIATSAVQTLWIDEINDLGGLMYGAMPSGVPIVYFPSSGTPIGEIYFYPRKAGVDDVIFILIYKMATGDTGVVKIDADIYVNGSLVDTQTDTIDPVNDDSIDNVQLTNIKVDTSDYGDADLVRIEFSRDNTVGSNHLYDFGLMNILVI